MSKWEDEAINGDAKYRQINLASSGVTEIPATKEFVVNATGNLFVATTLNGGNSSSAKISKEAETAFGQVSVFFAAMTKAMGISGKSLYDYQSINKVVSSSGLFVKVTDSNVKFTSKSWGVHFGNQLIQTLFGLSGNLASIGKSLTDMIIGVGKEANGIDISGNTDEQRVQVGTIIFVCEYLLGAVSITPIVLSVDAEDAKKVYEVGPCFKAESTSQEIRIIKQVYMFVPPEFVKEAASLNDAISDEQFEKLVQSISDSIDAT